MPQFVNTKIVLLAGKAGQRCNVPVAYLDCCNAAIIDRLRNGLCEYVHACVVCPSQGQGRGALYFLVKHMGTQTARTYIVRLTNAPSEATNWLYFAFYRDNLFSTLLGAITCLPVLHEVSLHEKTPLQCQTVLETFVHVTCFLYSHPYSTRTIVLSGALRFASKSSSFTECSESVSKNMLE